MKINEVINIMELPQTKRYELGFSDAIIHTFADFAIPLANFYLVQEDWFQPIMYFDNSNLFEYRFSAFRDDWTDRIQIQNFLKQMQLHSTKPRLN